jgi:CubicO group peptidase (beta-lactamase class C family)
MRLAVPWLCLCVVLKGATGNATPQLSAFDDFMNGLLAKWQIPGAALGVSRHGRLVLAHGYGVADVEAGPTVQPGQSYESWFKSAVLGSSGLSRVPIGPAPPDGWIAIVSCHGSRPN